MPWRTEIPLTLFDFLPEFVGQFTGLKVLKIVDFLLEGVEPLVQFTSISAVLRTRIAHIDDKSL